MDEDEGSEQQEQRLQQQKKRVRPAPPQVPGEGPPGHYDEEGRWHHPPFEGIVANRYTANTINDNFNMSDLQDFCRTYGVAPHPKRKRALIQRILRLVAEHRIAAPPAAASKDGGAKSEPGGDAAPDGGR